MAAKDASSSKGKPSVQVEPNRALLQKPSLQIAEKKTYTEEDRRKDEEAREAARQAAVEAGAEQYALDQHEKIVEQFEKGRKGIKAQHSMVGRGNGFAITFSSAEAASRSRRFLTI